MGSLSARTTRRLWGIAKALVARYKLDDVIGHEDIAPDRKNDPGPAFPMAALRVACGFKPEVKP